MPNDSGMCIPGLPMKKKSRGSNAGSLRNGALVVLLGAGIAQSAIADVNDTIARCALHEAKDDRIACLESELRALSGGGAEAGDVYEVPDEPVAASVPVEAAQPSPSTRGEFGSEQVERRNEGKSSDDAPVSATVVAFDVVGYQRLRVELDNGQVWRQTNGDRADVTSDLRDQETFEVELRRTGLGGYRMHIEPIDRTIRVERLE